MGRFFSSRVLTTILLGAATASPGLGQQLFEYSTFSTIPSATWGGIAVGHFNADAYADIVLSFRNNDLIAVHLGDGGGGFGAAASFPAGDQPWGMAVGDFNGDGKEDLGVANEGGWASVLLGDGSGGFGAPTSYAAGAPRYLVANDFDADGDLDLATANQDSDNVSVFLGNGDGTFLPQVTYAVDELPRGIVSGRFNADDFLDLAVATRTGNTVGLLLGNGDGTFQPQVQFPVLFTGRPSPIVGGDFDGDGSEDVAIGNDSTPGVEVRLGNGDGTFQPPYGYLTPLTPRSLGKGDFNGDGYLDLASLNWSDKSVSVLLGVGNGTFAPYLAFDYFFDDPLELVTSDLNADGFDDMVLRDGSWKIITLLINQVPFSGVCQDPDGDGFGVPGDPSCTNGAVTDCNNGDPSISPLAPDPCDGVDNNCDQMDGFDQDIDGSTTCGGDCNDMKFSVHPGAREFCNGLDEDCNGTVDVPAEEAKDIQFSENGFSLSWTVSTGFNVKYNVYRGPFGPGGLAYNHSCLASSLTQPQASDAQVPLTGSGFYYLATGRNSCGEGTPGSDFLGHPRPNTLPCP